MVFLATNVGLLLPPATPTWVTFLLPVPYLVPIAFIKHVKQLAVFSFIADAFLVFSMVMFYRYDNLAKRNDVETSIEWQTLPVFLGMAISSYEGIGLVRSTTTGDRSLLMPPRHPAGASHRGVHERQPAPLPSPARFHAGACVAAARQLRPAGLPH